MTRRITAATLIALLATSPYAQDAPKPEYVIKEDQARTGSMIRRELLESADVPINLSYDQLPAEARARFNANYVSMAQGDEPPFPIEGLKVILDPLRRAQAKLLVRGDLLMIAKVDSTGATQAVDVYSTPSPEMTQFAGRLLFLTPFKPARCAGQPCAMEFPLRMKFTVR